MSSTNKTTYYNLSQFANTDKPSWLNDYNNDMTIIDTNLKANANDISSNTTNINANTNSIGDLTNLTTANKDSLVSAINEVASSSGGGGVQILDVTNNSAQNPLIFDDLSIGEYILYFNNSSIYLTTKQLIVKNKSSDSSTVSITIASGATLKVMKKLEDMTNRYDYMGEVSYIYGSSYGKRKIYIANIGKTSTNKIEVNVNTNNFLVSTSEPTANKMIRTDNQGGVYWGEFNTIATGYDASKTQTLKNVNGTLTWVDDV